MRKRPHISKAGWVLYLTLKKKEGKYTYQILSRWIKAEEDFIRRRPETR
jgi:hypothetical protein